MRDLVLHFLAGGTLTALILLIFSKPDANCRRSDFVVIIATFASLFLGLAKEAADMYLHWGTPEVADVTFTWSGGLTAFFAIVIIDMIRFKRNARNDKQKRTKKRV